MTDRLPNVPIPATVAFSSNKAGAIVSIPPQPAETTFRFCEGQLVTANNTPVNFPDEETRMRVLVEYHRDPSSVFVVETASTGFLRDYAIDPA